MKEEEERKKGGLPKHATASFSALSQGRRQGAPPSSEPERERATSKNRTSDRLEPFERTELLLSLERAIFPRCRKTCVVLGVEKTSEKKNQNTPWTRVLCCLFCSPCFVLPWFVFDLWRLLWVNWGRASFCVFVTTVLSCDCFGLIGLLFWLLLIRRLIEKVRGGQWTPERSILTIGLTTAVDRDFCGSFYYRLGKCHFYFLFFMWHMYK